MDTANLRAIWISCLLYKIGFIMLLWKYENNVRCFLFYLSKAFDCIHQGILFAKLKFYDTRWNVARRALFSIVWFCNYLKHLSACVFQGRILKFLLFIYNVDVQTIYYDDDSSSSINNASLDDTIIISVVVTTNTSYNYLAPKLYIVLKN